MRKKREHSLETNRRRILFIRKGRLRLLFIIAIVLLIGGVATYKLLNPEQISQTEITKLADSGNCTQGIKATDSRVASVSNTDVSITLLSYRADCLRQLGRYQEAIESYEQLKSYYLQKHDSKSAAVVDSEILAARASIRQGAAPSRDASQPYVRPTKWPRG